jgi:hypothetical protein
MRKIKRRFRTVLALSLIAVAPSALPASARTAKAVPPDVTPKEAEMGKKYVEQLEKDPLVKLLDGSKDAKVKALLDKLNLMATTLGKVSARPLIKYSVKVLEDKDVNAFTLPGGHIYLSKGLLDTASSDDEVAAVIGHEIAHNSLMHVLREQSKTKPFQWISIAAMLAMLKGGETGANIAQITPYILTGVANRYTVGYEKEADAAAIEAMRQTSYNPSALVTFMQKLDDDEKRRPEVQLGIYQSHPLSIDRVQAAKDAIKKAGLTYSPRAVSGAREAVVTEEEDRASVMWDATPLFEYAMPKALAIPVSSTGTPPATPSVGVISPAKKRAQTTAARLNSMRRDNLRIYEISVNADGDEATLNARGQEIARATLDDAKLKNTTPLALAQTWRVSVQRLFWKESLNGSM